MSAESNPKTSSLAEDWYRERFIQIPKGCTCHACLSVEGITNPWWMVVCETCGNKRCPHANDHNNACTNSNETGQKGSVYE